MARHWTIYLCAIINWNNYRFDAELFFKRASSALNIGKQDLDPIPGTDKEWAFFIAVHELEHAGDHRQSSLENLASSIVSVLNSQKIRGVNEFDLRAHLKEIESDISAIDASKGLIDPAIPEYWAAHRIIVQDQGHMALAMEQAMKAEKGEAFYLNEIVAQHDTGFFIDEYLQTGEKPDYMEIQTAVNGFYLDTAQFFRAQMREHFKALGQGDAFDALGAKDMPELTTGQQMTLVMQAMQADPPVYGPAEMQIAARYLENMRTLGLEPEPLPDLDQELGPKVIKQQEALTAEAKAQQQLDTQELATTQNTLETAGLG